MNISYKWLKRYLKTNATAEELAKILTSIGLEVGTVETVETIKGGLRGLVVGEVLDCIDHPNSDHLHITRVDVGNEELQIVCGASNVAKGQKVVVATIGTTLYSGDESFTIKKSKMRGVESFGMICAEDEIGVGTSHEGIIVLPQDVKAGTLARDYYALEDDVIIEVDITPNRSDGASHYGVARDIAAYMHAHQEEYEFSRPSVDDFKVDNHALTIDVEVKNHERCPRYAGITITGARVAPSPEWLQNALNVIGLRPINNVVDVSNFILHSFAQPLHTFDASKIKGGKIVVRTANEGDKFVTLDGVERTLSADDLMICNAEEPMCIAGVFGGLESGVTDQTTDIFIESAYFNPVSIRKTARRQGLNTDASFRYERGIDPNITIYALKYAALLIKELTGGKISSEIIDVYPQKIENFKVNLNLDKARALIGKEIAAEMFERIFEALEIKVLEKNGADYCLEVPAYRVDVQRDVDVIEDVLRIYGYNNVELSTKLNANLSFSTGVDSNRWQNLISEQLTAQGFNEILNNSLTKESYYAELASFPAANCVKVINALSIDLSVLRQTLLFGGLESIARNANRQNADLKFYEFGNCYSFNSEKRASVDDPLKGYSENYHLSLWITGRKNALTWAAPAEPVTFYQLKAYVQNILVRTSFNLKELQMNEAQDDVLSEALEITTRQGKRIAIVGIVDKKLLKQFDISAPVYYADIVWAEVIKKLSKNKISYTELPKFPEVRRDLSLLIDKSVSFAQIEKMAYEIEKKLLKTVTLFDVYEGAGLLPGKKSYAINFTLQDAERTLTDKQIDAVMQRLIKAYEEKLGAKLR